MISANSSPETAPRGTGPGGPIFQCVARSRGFTIYPAGRLTGASILAAIALFTEAPAKGDTAFMFFSTAYAQGADPAAAAPNALVQLAPLVFIFVIFYFLLIRPQQQARKKHMEMVANVRRGDTVVTAGGIVGKVTKVLEGDDADKVMVELADNVTVKVLKATLTDIRSKSQPANDQ